MAALPHLHNPINRKTSQHIYSYDNRVVITLDAGGTNLVFGAMQANKFIVEPITLPAARSVTGSAFCVAFADRLPVDAVPQCRNGIGPPVAVVDVVGMLPDIDRQYGAQPFGQRIAGIGAGRSAERA